MKSAQCSVLAMNPSMKCLDPNAMTYETPTPNMTIPLPSKRPRRERHRRRLLLLSCKSCRFPRRRRRRRLLLARYHLRCRRQPSQSPRPVLLSTRCHSLPPTNHLPNPLPILLIQPPRHLRPRCDLSPVPLPEIVGRRQRRPRVPRRHRPRILPKRRRRRQRRALLLRRCALLWYRRRRRGRAHPRKGRVQVVERCRSRATAGFADTKAGDGDSRSAEAGDGALRGGWGCCDCVTGWEARGEGGRAGAGGFGGVGRGWGECGGWAWSGAASGGEGRRRCGRVGAGAGGRRGRGVGGGAADGGRAEGGGVLEGGEGPGGVGG